jgi:ERCC4-related helicase
LLSGWSVYLSYLDEGPYSEELSTSNLIPQDAVLKRERFVIPKLAYTLWPFQKEILDEIEEDTLIVGLPTGLGKTYLAGAKLHRESQKKPIRVLFLVPSVPLGVQQTIFVREKLKVEAFFVSGGIPPKQRGKLNVWNNAFIIATPQTFYNDNLAQYQTFLQEARKHEDAFEYLSKVITSFPFDIVVADECQRYIGQTDGYSTLLAAKACKVNILALSATPQLHAPHRLQELKKIFNTVKTFSVDAPGIREHMPERLLYIEQVQPPDKIVRAYNVLAELNQQYQFRIDMMYGPQHPHNCTRHMLCRALMALRMLRIRMMEDGASSVQEYETWKFKDLRSKRMNLEGKSIYELYQQAIKECYNHKLEIIVNILNREQYEKAIVYVESVEAAKQIAMRLRELYGLENVASLVGKGDMSTNQQASALLHFKQQAKILVCTSVGEEGLDIPSANIEVWVDPPSNPKKWIQRFGRILRQPGDKKTARIYALISIGTHERSKLLSVKKKVEKTYGFTQQLRTNTAKDLPKDQKRMIEYLK